MQDLDYCVVCLNPMLADWYGREKLTCSPRCRMKKSRHKPDYDDVYERKAIAIAKWEHLPTDEIYEKAAALAA